MTATRSSSRDPFRAPVLGLLALVVVLCAVTFGVSLRSRLLFDATLVMSVGGGALYMVLVAQRLRQGWRPSSTPLVAPQVYASTHWLAVGGAGVFFVLVCVVGVSPDVAHPPSLWVLLLALLCCGVATLSSLVAARYFNQVDVAEMPEAQMLVRGARVAGWAFVTIAFGAGAAKAGIPSATIIAHVLVLVGVAAISIDLIRASLEHAGDAAPITAPQLYVLELLGSRANIVASFLDGVERKLGIDLRSTWALAYARRLILPMTIALAIVGWLSTSISVIGRDEQALLERLGVPVGGPPLGPGLHVHLPWPFDRVLRTSIQQVRAVAIGHEEEGRSGGKETGGGEAHDEASDHGDGGGSAQSAPENVLWARAHAENEYTLLIGDGHDLLTVDASLQFRIVDARGWTYRIRNPTDALRASAYRAVMRATANRTLEAALSENVVALADQVKKQVQADADALGVGVEIVGFTIGGMHPPVAVAADYQAVVSAELNRTTAIVNAQAVRNAMIPEAEAAMQTAVATERADSLRARAQAAASAWSFRALEAQYRAEPSEYRFRRRLETLEQGLAGRHFTIVDMRLLRDGGGLWLTR